MWCALRYLFYVIPMKDDFELVCGVIKPQRSTTSSRQQTTTCRANDNDETEQVHSHKCFAAMVFEHTHTNRAWQTNDRHFKQTFNSSKCVFVRDGIEARL